MKKKNKAPHGGKLAALPLADFVKRFTSTAKATGQTPEEASEEACVLYDQLTNNHFKPCKYEP